MRRKLFIIYDIALSNHIFNLFVVLGTALVFALLMFTINASEVLVANYNKYLDYTNKTDSVILRYDGPSWVYRNLGYYIPEKDEFSYLEQRYDCSTHYLDLFVAETDGLPKNSAVFNCLKFDGFYDEFFVDLNGTFPTGANEIVMDQIYSEYFSLGDTVDCYFLDHEINKYVVSLRVVGFCSTNDFVDLFGLKSDFPICYVSDELADKNGNNMYALCSWGNSGFIEVPKSFENKIEEIRGSLISPNESKTASDQIENYIRTNQYSVVNSFVWFVFSLCFLVVLYIGRNIIMVYKNRNKLKIYYIWGFGYSELLICHIIYELVLFCVSVIIGFSCLDYLSELMNPFFANRSISISSVVLSLVILFIILMISAFPYLVKLNKEYILED